MTGIVEMKRKPADLFLREVIRWEPEHGFLRVEQHMRRLCRSADVLGFRAPTDPIKQLKAHVSGDAALKVSLQLNHRGEMAIERELFQPLAGTVVWRIRFAEKSRLDSKDTFYRHKSTRREPYVAARLEHDAQAIDEVLLLNERGEVCEGTETSLFIDDGSGTLLTPPLNSGILPGVLRADLIRARKARSQPIFRKTCKVKIFLLETHCTA
jgi:4-amino-4-deoxychorismate lyase